MDIERADFEDELLEKGLMDQLHTARALGQEEEFLDKIEKSLNHKYFKREPNKNGKGYRYYYTEAEYKAATQTPEEKEKERKIKWKEDKLSTIRGYIMDPEKMLQRGNKSRATAIGAECYNYNWESVVEAIGFKMKVPKELRPQQFQSGYFKECMKLGQWIDERLDGLDATDHIIKEGDTYKIDILDPDTEEKKFKKGDKIKFEGKTGTVGKDLGDDIHEVILDK